MTLIACRFACQQGLSAGGRQSDVRSSKKGKLALTAFFLRLAGTCKRSGEHSSKAGRATPRFLDLLSARLGLAEVSLVIMIGIGAS